MESAIFRTGHQHLTSPHAWHTLIFEWKEPIRVVRVIIDARTGSLNDIRSSSGYVRFNPGSSHRSASSSCPLGANNGSRTSSGVTWV
jgi:hypothetical protein